MRMAMSRDSRPSRSGPPQSVRASSLVLPFHAHLRPSARQDENPKIPLETAQVAETLCETAGHRAW